MVTKLTWTLALSVTLLHSTKTFENLETAANGAAIFRKSFQEIWKLLNFRNANHSTENSRNSGSKVEWKENSGKKSFENLGIPREVVVFFENFGKSCSIRYWKLPKIQTGHFGWMESALYFQFTASVSLSPCSLPARSPVYILKATLTNGEFKLKNHIVLQ